jgi:hypothetical protein
MLRSWQDEWVVWFMSMSTCPQCGAALKRGEIERKSVAFPCPTCGVQLQFPDWYLILTFYGAIAAPPLIFWALGFSWPHLVIAELIFGYPILWVVVHYGKYILRPKLMLYVPRPRLGGRTELHLRDRPRP